jgi:hypothetical protein
MNNFNITKISYFNTGSFLKLKSFRKKMTKIEKYLGIYYEIRFIQLALN